MYLLWNQKTSYSDSIFLSAKHSWALLLSVRFFISSLCFCITATYRPFIIEERLGNATRISSGAWGGLPCDSHMAQYTGTWYTQWTSCYIGKLGQIQSLNCTKFVHIRKKLLLQNTCTLSISTKWILNLNFVTSNV